MISFLSSVFLTITLLFIVVNVSQVFIGHAESISQVFFCPDKNTFISTGEAIFIWDFMANYMDTKKLESVANKLLKYTLQTI
jgi:WD40 repeat protein